MTRFTITREDALTPRANGWTDCMLARSIKRELPRCSIKVGFENVWIDEMRYPLPEEVERLIRLYMADSQDQMELPHEFSLPVFAI